MPDSVASYFLQPLATARLAVVYAFSTQSNAAPPTLIQNPSRITIPILVLRQDTHDTAFYKYRMKISASEARYADGRLTQFIGLCRLVKNRDTEVGFRHYSAISACFVVIADHPARVKSACCSGSHPVLAKTHSAHLPARGLCFRSDATFVVCCGEFRTRPSAGSIRHFLPYFAEQVWATNIWVNGWMDCASPLDTV